MKKYFQILEGGVDRVFILQDGTRFDTRLDSVPASSFKVWKDGRFKHIALLPAATELFEKEKAADLIAIINKSKRIEDIQILALAKPDAKTVQDAATARINLLTNTQ